MKHKKKLRTQSRLKRRVADPEAVIFVNRMGCAVAEFASGATYTMHFPLPLTNEEKLKRIGVYLRKNGASFKVRGK